MRSTPAYAGNTQRGYMVGPGARVHPRVCGEHAEEARSHPADLGSPPRMRGTRRPRGGRVDESVHPRVCGEHHDPGGGGLSRWGSPPRMRVTHHTTRHNTPNTPKKHPLPTPINKNYTPTLRWNTKPAPYARARPTPSTKNRVNNSASTTSPTARTVREST